MENTLIPAIQPITDEQFAKLDNEIHTYWPTAKYLPEDEASISAFDYSQRLVQRNLVSQTEDRRLEFQTLFREKVQQLLGEEVAQSVYNQLSTNHAIGTAQHYTHLTPNTLNATLLTALAYFDNNVPDRENLIVLACAGVSFNNPWHGRGHFFHSLINGIITQHQLNFFGRAADQDPIISMPAYTSETHKTLEKTLAHLRSEKLIDKNEFTTLTQNLNEIYFTPEVLSKKNYVDQVSVTNFHLWKKMFEGYEGHVPNLIFLSQEKIASELLLRFHLHNQTILHDFLFNKQWHELIYKHFNNIMCAFSLEKKAGTFLFWGMSKNGKNRIQLFMKDGVLSSQDGSFVLEMTPGNVSNALTNNEIVPGVMLTFVILSMYYGYSLLGGLYQPWYLSETKKAYLAILSDLNMNEEIKNCEPIVTNLMIPTRPNLALINGHFSQRIRASGLDLALRDISHSWSQIIEASKQITFKELLYRLYPILYKEFCEHEPKDEYLLSLTERDVERYTGIDKKIPPLITLT